MIDKKVIITSSVLLAALLIIYIILSSLKPIISNEKELKVLNDAERYFQIQATIAENIEEENYYDAPMYIATNIKYNTYENRTYYYIHGYILDSTYSDDVNYIKDVNYFMITKGNTYKLEKIKTDIESYAKSIDISKLTISEGKLLTISSYTEEGKLSAYISNYVNLLSVDQNEASKLINYTKNNLSPVIKDYRKQENDGKVIYTVLDDNSNRLEIEETSIMNYFIRAK